MRWSCVTVLALAIAPGVHAQKRAVRIGVLSIFHPQQLTLTTDAPEGLLISAAQQHIYLRTRSICAVMRVRAAGEALVIGCGTKEVKADAVRATNRNEQPASFFLDVPSRLRRRYEGILEIKAKNNELITVITMDLETAVASVVQAESNSGTPAEALKAQAIVTRSYFAAGGGRHIDFDFCDLTHCQFLREPPAPDAPAVTAAAATRGLVLIYNEKPITAMFTRSCAGQTRNPREIGLSTAEYPYFSVHCDFCSRHPARWTREVSPSDAALLFQRGEAGRLVIGRRLGWNAVPSNNFTASKQNGTVTLHGIGLGHGIGMCQSGARDMAEHGSDYRQILEHYFPNTRIEDLFAAR